MKLPPNARAEGLTRMAPIHLKGRGLISRRGTIRPRGLERANSVRDKRADFSIVRDRERTLEAFRLVRKIVASGRGDDSFVPSEVVARFRATSRKLLRPKLTFSARIVSNRTSAFRRPLSSYSMRSFLPFVGSPRHAGRRPAQPTESI